jgi:hypothetical protein
MEKSKQLHPQVRDPGTHKTGIWRGLSQFGRSVEEKYFCPCQDSNPFSSVLQPIAWYFTKNVDVQEQDKKISLIFL